MTRALHIHAPSFIRALVSLTVLICAAQESEANSSYPALPFSGFTSVSSRDLFEAIPDLHKRQTGQCSLGPGGPICSPTTCCAAGQLCCPGGCCPNTAACFRTDRCCPLTGTICPGETACCPAGSPCCGSGCCVPGYICERNECISQALKDKVVRFDIKKKNRELLKNMCNGMRGKNTETLTYRGPDKEERDQTRIEAGCGPGYCANLIDKGLVPASFDSCDEYPPASSLEGGNARDPLQRAINCIPLRQNNHQGGKFGGFQSTLRKLGLTFQRGDKFVVSIDCDKVLGDLVPRTPARDEESKRDAGMVDHVIVERDVSLNGNETIDLDVLNDDQPEFSYLVAPLGDLQPGTYSVKIQVTSGSTAGSFVLDNQGWNYTANDDGTQAGQSRTYSFILEYWTPGMGVFLATTDNSTSIVWNLEGRPPATPTPTPTSAITSGCERLRFPWILLKSLTIWILALTFAST